MTASREAFLLWRESYKGNQFYSEAHDWEVWQAALAHVEEEVGAIKFQSKGDGMDGMLTRYRADVLRIVEGER